MLIDSCGKVPIEKCHVVVTSIETKAEEKCGNHLVDTAAGKQKKQRNMSSPNKRKRRNISIPLETLLLHSHKTLEQAAKALYVSTSTLKRIRDDHGFSQWSDMRRISSTFGGVRRQLCFQPLVTTSPPHQTASHDVGEAVTVKATYCETLIKFKLFASSKIEDLKEEVTKRLKLEVGSFRLEYKDEDGDWILLGCDVDLKDCVDTLRSLDNNTVKMLVSLITH